MAESEEQQSALLSRLPEASAQRHETPGYFQVIVDHVLQDIDEVEKVLGAAEEILDMEQGK